MQRLRDMIRKLFHIQDMRRGDGWELASVKHDDRVQASRKMDKSCRALNEVLDQMQRVMK